MSEWVEGKPTKPEEVEYVRLLYWTRMDGETFDAKVIRPSIGKAYGSVDAGLVCGQHFTNIKYWNDQVVSYKLKEG